MKGRGTNGSGILLSEEFRGSLSAHSPLLSTAKRQERMGSWVSIQEIMIAAIDTKVSIGTFVQLIRLLSSGRMETSSQISTCRAGEHRLQSDE